MGGTWSGGLLQRVRALGDPMSVPGPIVAADLKAESAVAPRVAALLVAFSGLSALVIQVAWFRLFRLVFGASTAANAAVLAVFLGGLGVGGILLGGRADRTARPLRLFGLLELGVATATVASPFLLTAARAAWIGAGGTRALGPWTGAGLQLLLAAAVMGPAAVAMGGTLPAMVRAAQVADDPRRRGMALLYGTNTLGAVVGAGLATFVLLEQLGVRGTLWGAAALDVVVAGAALLADRKAQALTDVGAAAPTSPGSRWALPVVGAGVTGFVFVLMELVWYRMLGPILGGSSYTFGIVLAVALLGIGAGGVACSRRSEDDEATTELFAVTCLLEALALGAPLLAGDEVARLALWLRALEVHGFAAMALGWTVTTALVVLPAALIAGYQFPLLVASMGRGRAHVGREVGLVYGANTLGSIVGSLAGGFGLLPLLTAPGAWRLSVALMVGLGLLFAAASADRRRAAPVMMLAAVGLAVASFATGPTAIWRHSGIGAGRAPEVFAGPIERREWENHVRRRLAWEQEGVESSVALVTPGGNAFMINGKIDGAARGDAHTQVMLGLLGAALHPEPHRALVIGLGTGSTAGWLGKVPSIDDVEVLELEEAVVDIARACDPVNEGYATNPKVHVRIGDAREGVPTAPGRFDLIISEPSNPYRAGIASLFTQEFYAAAKERLEPGGLFVQWVQAYEVDPRTIGTVYATLGSVFPSVETWEVGLGSDLVFVASNEPLVHDLDALEARLTAEPYDRALAGAWGVQGVAGLFTGFVAAPGWAPLAAARDGASICTDDNGVVEFGFARSAGGSEHVEVADLRALARDAGFGAPNTRGDATVDPSDVEEQRVARRVSEGREVTLPETSAPASSARNQARRAYAVGDLDGALRAWSAQGEGPRSPIDGLLLAESLAPTGLDEALPAIAALEASLPPAGLAARARWSWARGETGPAAVTLARAFVAWRTDPWPLPGSLQRALDLAVDVSEVDPVGGLVLYDALAEPFAVNLLQDERHLARFRIARRAAPERCAEALAPLEPWVPWQSAMLRPRVDCYTATGDPALARARRELAEYEASAASP